MIRDRAGPAPGPGSQLPRLPTRRAVVRQFRPRGAVGHRAVDAVERGTRPQQPTRAMATPPGPRTGCGPGATADPEAPTRSPSALVRAVLVAATWRRSGPLRAGSNGPAQVGGLGADELGSEAGPVDPAGRRRHGVRRRVARLDGRSSSQVDPPGKPALVIVPRARSSHRTGRG